MWDWQQATNRTQLDKGAKVVEKGRRVGVMVCLAQSGGACAYESERKCRYQSQELWPFHRRLNTEGSL